MSARGLAYRRHHERRLKNKWRTYCELFYEIEPTDEVVGKLFRTPVPCSCPMCGNPRRHFGERTIQERKNIG